LDYVVLLKAEREGGGMFAERLRGLRYMGTLRGRIGLMGGRRSWLR
jgi:hypothetical protein